MPNIGVYDAEIRALAWFDPTAVANEGWFDYGMPFEHDLITVGAAPVDPFPLPYEPINLLLRLCLAGAFLCLT